MRPWRPLRRPGSESQPVASAQAKSLQGLGIQAQETLGDPADTRFFHGDLIDSTMMTTDECGSMGFQPVSYTAFGEPVWRDGQGQTHVGWPFPPAGGGSPPAGLGTRYQYAGGWGYESGPWGQDPNDAASPGPLVLYGGNPDLPPILLLHVGERWYQPGTGRFVQRDPIGVLAALNAYLYSVDNPVASADPSGLIGIEMGTSWPPDPHKSKEERQGERKGIVIGTGIVAGAVCTACAPGAAVAAGRALGPTGGLLGKGAWINRGMCRFGWSWKAKEGWKLSLRWKNWHWDIWP